MIAAGVVAGAARARRGLVARAERIDGDRPIPPPPPALALALRSTLGGVAIVAIIATDSVAITVTLIGGSVRAAFLPRPPTHIAIAAASTACTATELAPAIEYRIARSCPSPPHTARPIADRS